ncbi:hypothetical protein KAR91_48615 [Candidatus Pacearchaeota archaeon]|nr:hypothetical protein [Candidatus Pacearchaeota archaeon]
MAYEEIKKKLNAMAEDSDGILVTIDDPYIDEIKGDFVLGSLLRLIADSLG